MNYVTNICRTGFYCRAEWNRVTSKNRSGKVNTKTILKKWNIRYELV